MTEMECGRRDQSECSEVSGPPARDGKRSRNADRLAAGLSDASLGPLLADLTTVAWRQGLSIVIVPEPGVWSVLLVVPGEQNPRLRARRRTLAGALKAILGDAARLGM